jgi:hypothetical protein
MTHPLVLHDVLESFLYEHLTNHNEDQIDDFIEEACRMD